MNTSGCPAFCWLLCLQYICVVLNHLASPTLQGICPVQALQGTTPDVSFMLHFSFYEPVYYRIDSSEPDLNFPSSSNEKKGYWVGFADNQGDSFTWRILTEDTHKIIICSGVRSALSTTTNQCIASTSGEATTLPFPIPYPQQFTNSLLLDPLDASTPNLSNLSKDSLVKMKIIQSTCVKNSSSRFFQISCSQGILNSSRLSCYLLLRLLVYMYLSQLMRTFTNYLKCIVISF